MELKLYIKTTNMKKCRIIKRTFISVFDGVKRTTFTIQQKKYLFGCIWEDAGCWSNNIVDTFDTLEEAMENIPCFDGTKSTNGTEIVYKNY